MSIRLTAGETVLTATLDDNATARDFASLLPLTLRMDDLFKRERYGRLSRSLAVGGEPRFSYEIGDIAYWSPGLDIAVFYAHDGESIPDPGMVILGKIDHLGADALKKCDGAVDVAIEVID
ncbi:Cyclophilin-like [Streptomyces sp. 3213]|uniref:cyclophilin-like fold protein n=1 Tax=Streptomyces sp. 3213.3 TaxID=1855348 RepID=UPI00089A1150|nr:cyclophilin-like fold protein [Streptomyces sp. 3213.3]SEC24424.1 Cyclophilin-like [Streptomyces sp. 3213] [Streptomyces sp. 3213.3]